jgi:hypothetical protein
MRIGAPWLARLMPGLASGSQGAAGGDHRLLRAVRGHLGDTAWAGSMDRIGQEATMKEILDTILDPSSQTEDFVAPLPEA